MDTAGLAVEMMQSAKMDPPEIYIAKFQVAIDTIQQQTAKMVAHQYNGQIMSLDQKLKKLCISAKDVVVHFHNDGTAVDGDWPKDDFVAAHIDFENDEHMCEFVSKIAEVRKVIEEEFQITFPEIYDGD